MKHIRQLLFIVLVIAFVTPVHAVSQAEEKKGIDLQEILFGHIQDSYDWHITTINGHHVTIYLPIIVKSSTRIRYVKMSMGEKCVLSIFPLQRQLSSCL